MLTRWIAAAALLCLSLPTYALGSLVDVQVIDRASGETLPMYWHNGRWWVPGKPGARYAVALTNRTGARTLAVVSVDGVNVVSGESAAPDQTGYVLSRGQFAQITGWRKDMTRVAAFEFTALEQSYAARTGRPDNIGVIGVAVFRERPRPSTPPPAVLRQESSRDAGAAPAPASEANAGAGEARSRADDSQSKEQRLAPDTAATNGRRPRTPTSSAPRPRPMN